MIAKTLTSFFHIQSGIIIQTFDCNLGWFQCLRPATDGFASKPQQLRAALTHSLILSVCFCWKEFNPHHKP